MSGKGSAPRPFSVDRKTFEKNWDSIFKKNHDNRDKTNKSDNSKSAKDDRK